jgi:uncharacterized Zn finger protein (UPF0148 family)
MEKYGVQEGSKDLDKLASQGCPNCGSNNIKRHGDVLVCPNCGTEPFEENKHVKK